MTRRTRMLAPHEWRGIGPVSEDDQLDLFPHGYRLGWWTFWSGPADVPSRLRRAEAAIRRMLRLDEGSGR